MKIVRLDFLRVEAKRVLFGCRAAECYCVRPSVDRAAVNRGTGLVGVVDGHLI